MKSVARAVPVLFVRAKIVEVIRVRVKGFISIIL
jgi:hypothetical protein